MFPEMIYVVDHDKDTSFILKDVSGSKIEKKQRCVLTG